MQVEFRATKPPILDLEGWEGKPKSIMAEIDYCQQFPTHENYEMKGELKEGHK